MTARMHGRAKLAIQSFTPVQSGVLQRKYAGASTPGSTGEREECREKKLQLRLGNLPAPSSNNHQPETASQVPPIVHEVLRLPGQPLDAATRDFMEPRFGYDFSQVRVHTDAKAVASARAVDAAAYTVGQQIVLGSATSFHSIGYRKILAHELAHTIQQGNGDGPNSFEYKVAPADDVSEREAQAAATAVVNDRHTRSPSSFKRSKEGMPRVTNRPPISLSSRRPSLQRWSSEVYFGPGQTAGTSAALLGVVKNPNEIDDAWKTIVTTAFDKELKLEGGSADDNKQDAVQIAHTRAAYVLREMKRNSDPLLEQKIKNHEVRVSTKPATSGADAWPNMIKRDIVLIRIERSPR